MSSDDDIRKFAETYKITFPFGRENVIAGPLGVRGIPVTVFIGNDGRIVKRYFGATTYADLDANIRTILKWLFHGGGIMDKDKIGDLFSKMSPVLKKELLNDLVASLLKDVSETDKKQVLQSILAGRQGSGQVIDMVERWIQECTDSGVNPVEMSKEVISAISHSYELATYSTPELRGLFNDWLGEIEREVLEFLSDRNTVDPGEVAGHFKLERESAIFILSKLAREGKINIQASGNW